MQPAGNTVFFEVLNDVDQGLFLAATKLFPTGSPHKFTSGSKGRFELIFDKAYKGTAMHINEKFNRKLVGKPPLQLAQVVKGTINEQEKSIRFDSDGIIVTIPLEKWGMSVDVQASITEIKAVENGLRISAKCGLEVSETIDYDLVLGAFVDWK